MHFQITRIEDSVDCETCGPSWVSGYQIFKGDELIISKIPIAACFDEVDFSGHDPRQDILDHLGIQVSEGYLEGTPNDYLDDENNEQGEE